MRKQKWLSWLLIGSLFVSAFLFHVSIASASKEQQSTSSIKELYRDYEQISAWALEAIQQATDNGFVQGSAGKFNPKKPITRAEFTKILAAMLDFDVTPEQTGFFTDVTDQDWFAPYVNTAFNKGLITGYANKFQPNATITREEMAVIIARALELEFSKSASVIKDSNKVSEWAKQAVEAVTALGIMTGDAAGFHANQAVTREMAAVVAVRAYVYKEDSTAFQKSLEIAKITEQLKKTSSFLQAEVTNPVIASVGGDWTIFGLARSGIPIDAQYYSQYVKNVEQFLIENSSKLHHVKYTEYGRVILALTAIGKDITNAAGYDLREPLADFETVIKQGINGPIFALIALDSKSYDIPVAAGVKKQTTRELLIQFILDREVNGGGWALGNNPSEADPDITAMAIQSLTPYYKNNEKVTKAIDRGLSWLSNVQHADGGYATWETVNSQSVAQVIVALTGLGINPDQDVRFIKNGNSVFDALLAYSDVKGGFYYVKSGGSSNGGANSGQIDLMATDQAFYALSSYERFLTNKNRLYDLSDV
ncbi:S-layer homology domain-containing protein [Paenibacillus sp. GXUN7292]|uniref:S-layer homology domain-containing protein n=1 Tax=Paenibacillus sp. GXUN7292 TaxID=3422499 RepID=UPI003D7E8B69